MPNTNSNGLRVRIGWVKFIYIYAHHIPLYKLNADSISEELALFGHVAQCSIYTKVTNQPCELR